MSAPSQPFFLFLGHSDSDAPVSKLKTAGVPYRKKILESRPDNWDKIVSLLEAPGLRGVIALANGRTWARFLEDEYRDRAEALFSALSKVPHILLVHEAVLTGDRDTPEEAVGEDDEVGPWYDDVFRSHFWQPDDEVRAQVQGLLRKHGINPIPYRTNAERSVLAASFLDDNERDLLFRVYVPAGRLYAQEADRLLCPFRDWLGQVGRHSVRQDGYRTGAGQVYEFFGDGSLAGADLSREFTDFSGFLELCVADPSAAADQLARQGIELLAGAQLVSRYGKEVRRLHTDLRRARETRMLTIRHSLETDLMEAAEPPPAEVLGALLERCVPSPDMSPLQVLLPTLASGMPTSPINVHLTQQFIENVQGNVIQSVQGVVNLSPEARELISLVEQFAEEDQADLLSAVHELEDVDARNTDRVRARQRLKGFLFRISGQVESTAFSLLQKYLESKFGL